MVVNEKISWKQLLIALVVCKLTTSTIKTYKDYSYYNNLLTIINSDKSIPNSKELAKVNAVRLEVIENIKNSNKFDKFNKSFIIDSIRNIKFKFVDTIDFASDGTVGCYINLEPISKKYYKNLLPNISDNNFIIIDRRLIDKPYIAEIISHEIYHYFDKLSGNEDKYYSEINKVDDIIDKKAINDEKYSCNKMSLIMTGYKYDLLSPELKTDILSMIKTLNKDKDYYSSNKELFARWKSFKGKLLKDKLINNINDIVTLSDIIKAFQRSDYIEDQFLSMIFFIDLKRVENINI